MRLVLALVALLLSSHGIASSAKPLLSWATNTAPRPLEQPVLRASTPGAC